MSSLTMKFPTEAPAHPTAQNRDGGSDEKARMSFSTILRGAGAAAVIAALAAFLLRGWAGGNDLIKFGMLLFSTVGLAAVAVAIVRTLHESKGPRVLLSLALVAVPVNFAVLGAFLLYATNLSAGITYPDYFAWSIESTGAALAVLGGSLVLLVPVVAIGFRTLTRTVSTRLTLFFLASNLALLVPVRESFVVAGLVVSLLALALFMLVPAFRADAKTRTQEGRIAMMLQFLPIGILLGRGLWLYSADQVVLLAMTGVVWLLLRQMAIAFDRRAAIFNMLSLVPTAAAGLLVMDLAISVGLSAAVAILVGSLLTSALAYELSTREQYNRGTYRTIAMLSMVIGVSMSLFGADGVALSIAGVWIGVGLLLASYYRQQRSLFITGSVVSMLSVASIGLQMFLYFSLGSWVTLLIVGVGAIAAASLVDAHGERIRGRLKEQRQQFSDWEY